jgi:hypothetical protein
MDDRTLKPMGARKLRVQDYIRILSAAVPVLGQPRSFQLGSPIDGKEAVRLAGVKVSQLRKILGELLLVPGIDRSVSEILAYEPLADPSNDAEPIATSASTSIPRLDAALRHLGGQVALLLLAFKGIVAGDDPPMITSLQGLYDLIDWLRSNGIHRDESIQSRECSVKGWEIVRSTSTGKVMPTYSVAAKLAGLPLIAPWVIDVLRAELSPQRLMPYCIGNWNGFDGERGYRTLADAAEAIRVARGWSEIHLSERQFETEASIPVFLAYPTAEQRDLDWQDAPYIWETCS